MLALLKEPELAVWAAFVVAMPFYVVKNGRPQPADLLTLLLVPLVLRRGLPKIPQPLRLAIIALFVFAIYAAIVNILWGILLIDYNIVKVGAFGFASFYLFNAYVFAAALVAYVIHGVKYLVITAWATMLSVVVQLILFGVLGGGGGFREKLFFNNPNQLGYYSLLAATIIAFGAQRGRIPAWIAGAALAVTAVLAALSLSKAAIVGTMVMAVVAAARKPILLIVAVAALAAGMAIRDPDVLLDKVAFRMNEIGDQSDDNLEGRGYSRIEMHPEYLILGAGEVGHNRHGDFGGELHSSFATVLFSYGVVGFAILLAFLWRALRWMRVADLLFLVPVFLYGLTHQGLRFRLFWVFLAFMCASGFHSHFVQGRRPTRVVRQRRVADSARGFAP